MNAGGNHSAYQNDQSNEFKELKNYKTIVVVLNLQLVQQLCSQGPAL